MKKLLLSLALVLGMSSVASAVEVNLPGTDKKWDSYTWTQTGDNYTGVVENYTFLLEKAGSTSTLVAPDQYSIRVYANAKLTITAPADVTFTKLEVTINSTGNKATAATASVGTVSAFADGKFTVTMDAPVSTVTIDGAGKQLRVGSIVVTASGEGTTPGGGGDTPVTPPVDPGVSIANTAETAYTVTKALEILAAGQDLNTEVYVKGEIKSITEVSTQYGNATYVITDGTSDLTVFRGYYLNGDKFTAADQIAVGQELVLLGKLTTYNGAAQVNTGSKIISIDGQGEKPAETVTVATLADALAQAVNTPVKYTGTATVVWQHLNSLYVKDANTNALIYGKLTQTYASGDQISGFEAKVSEYQGVKQLVPVADTFTAGTAGTAVEPMVIQVEEVASDMVNEYVKFVGVTIEGSDRTYTMTDASGSITLYQNWTDIAIKTGTDMTVVGFIGLHSGLAQILAAEVTGEGGEVPPVTPIEGEQATFNFADPSTLTPAYSLADAEDDGSTGNKKIDFTTSNFSNNGITFSTVASGNPARLYYQTSKEAWTYRVYKNSVTTITCPDGYKLLEVTFDPQTSTYKTALGNCEFSKGTFADNKLTMPADETITSVTITNPANGGATIGFNSVTVTFKNISGIADVELDQNAPATYYNLQGVEVKGDLTPGLYIRRQGNNATKVIVK